MPSTTRTFVKASFLYLCLGSLLGALMLVDRAVPLGPAVAYVRVSHIQLLIVGWLTQLILGVAWWLFPPLKTGLRPDGLRPARRGQSQRGSEWLLWVSFVCLNSGTLLRAVFDPLYGWSKIGVFGFLTGISGLLLFIAAAIFVLNVWHRIRELGRRRSPPT